MDGKVTAVPLRPTVDVPRPTTEAQEDETFRVSWTTIWNAFHQHQAQGKPIGREFKTKIKRGPK